MKKIKLVKENNLMNILKIKLQNYFNSDLELITFIYHK